MVTLVRDARVAESDRPQREVPSSGDPNASAPATGNRLLFLAALVPLGLAAGALVVAEPANPFVWVGAVLVALWTLAALALERRREPLGALVLLGAIVGGVALLAAAVDDRGTETLIVDAALRLALALLPAVAYHVLLSLPGRGRLSPSRRRLAIAGYVIAGVTGLAMLADREQVLVLPLFALWAAALASGLYLSNAAYREAGAVDRRRMQWIGWALAVCAEVVLVVSALNLLTNWPTEVGLIAFAATGLVPLSVIAGTVGRLVMRVDRLLTYTVSLAGLTTLVVAVYLLVVIGLGRRPEGDERSLLLLSMARRRRGRAAARSRPAIG